MTTNKRDYYEILGLSRDANSEEIKKAFRQQALKYHPDKNKDPDASERFKEVNEAYQVLSNPEKKSQYDQFGHAGVNNGGASGFGGFEGFGGFGDIFDSFFGGTTSERANVGNDLEYQIKISFKDAAFGVKKQINLSRNERCDTCNGNKAEPGSKIDECSVCQGTGKVSRVQKTIFGQFQQVTSCSTCSGDGIKINNKCKKCDGLGIKNNSRKIEVSVPAGIEDGTRLIIRGEGESIGKQGRNGDLYVHILVDEDEHFNRKGNDIIVLEEISVILATLGGEIDIKTLDGNVKLKIKPGTQSDSIIRLPNLGIPFVGQSSRRGDQLVRIKVLIPTKIDDTQKAIFIHLANYLKLDNVNKDVDESIIRKFKDFFKSDNK